VIHEMNSEEWEWGDDCLAVICVFVLYVGKNVNIYIYYIIYI
jgi:hypothetical protein